MTSEEIAQLEKLLAKAQAELEAVHDAPSGKIMITVKNGQISGYASEVIIGARSFCDGAKWEHYCYW